jgi:hypothetical protein
MANPPKAQRRKGKRARCVTAGKNLATSAWREIFLFKLLVFVCQYQIAHKPAPLPAIPRAQGYLLPTNLA